jgi:type IV pilus assembly protein PilQ
MIALKNNFTTLVVRMGAFLALVLGGNAALAQENAIESITANQQGSNVVVNIAMKSTPQAADRVFDLESDPHRA